MKAYRYRIYPDVAQQALLEKHFGCVRHIYNWALGLKDKFYQENQKNLSRSELQRRLVASKKEEKPWLSEVNSQSLLSSLLHLETAFINFFRGRAKFPRFKKKYAACRSFQCPQHVTVDFNASLLNLPKLKGIKIKLHRQFIGEIKTVTIKRIACGEYYASILVDNQITSQIPPLIEADKTLGLDVGINHFYTDSAGNRVTNPKFLKKYLHRLAVAQRMLSRKKKESKNRAKRRLLLANIHNRISNLRSNFIHQESAKLVVKNHATSFAVESLHIKGMIKNRRLARSIADCGWRMFLNALAYKCQEYGKNLLAIDRWAPSSKICSRCGIKQPSMPLEVRKWDCECGASHDRDHNAAQMILQFALAEPSGYCAVV